VAVDIGSTPFGFAVPTVVGGVKITGSVGNTSGLSYQVEASRRAVTDSVLSFAGTRDSRSGETFGGVTANGVRGQVGKDFGDAGVYAYGSYQALLGQHVESNTRAEGGVGFYKHLIREENRQLSTGVNVSATSYDKNLSNFTYGQGGYFSPQQFFAINVPVTWSQRGSQYSYQLKGSVGIQHFKEDDSPYFPSNSGMQNAANAAAAQAYALGLTGSPSARYSGQSKTGIGYNLGAAGEYQLAPQFSVGGALSLDNASDYRQLIASLYARYTFDAIRGPLPLPVEPFRSPYTQ
jgi:hypothetical protein